MNNLYNSKKLGPAVLTGTTVALKSYRAGLKTRLHTRDAMLAILGRISSREEKTLASQQDTRAKTETVNNKKENIDMKRFISAIAVLAAAAAAVGAAGYYLYKKTKTEESYDDLLVTEEMGEEFEIVDEAYTDEETIDVEDVKEAIENATEE